MSLSLNTLAKDIHIANIAAGWWSICTSWHSKPPPVGYGDKYLAVAGDLNVLGTKIALIHSEVSEMMEGLRKGFPDDHLTHRSMEEVEAADIFIRLFDYCGARGLDIDGAIAEKRAYNEQRADHQPDARAEEHGKKF